MLNIKALDLGRGDSSNRSSDEPKGECYYDYGKASSYSALGSFVIGRHRARLTLRNTPSFIALLFNRTHYKVRLSLLPTIPHTGGYGVFKQGVHHMWLGLCLKIAEARQTKPHMN